MKTKVIVTLCVVFVLGLVSHAHAQLIAGSPEDKAYSAINAENNADAKLNLLLQYEKDFPQSKVLSDIYIMQMDVYRQKNDTAKVIEVGEKAIRLDGENVTALMTVARNLALERRNLDRAVQYAQKAVDTIAKLKTQSPPPGTSDEQWKQYIAGTDSAAQSILAYTKSLRP
jgi:hypothetical protein